MPLYDYDCAACGTRFEVVHGVHADPPTTCPACGKGPVKKAFTPPTIHFKGSGWAKKERRATVSPGGAKSRVGEGSSASGSETGSGGGAAEGGSGTKEAGTPASDGSASKASSTAASGPAAD